MKSLLIGTTIGALALTGAILKVSWDRQAVVAGAACPYGYVRMYGPGAAVRCLTADQRDQWIDDCDGGGACGESPAEHLEHCDGAHCCLLEYTETEAEAMRKVEAVHYPRKVRR